MAKHVPMTPPQKTYFSGHFEIPSCWGVETAQFTFNEVRDGTHDSPKKVSIGIPLVTSKNLKSSGIDFSTVSYISQLDHDEISKRSCVKTNDVLFSMIGTIGNVALVGNESEFSIKNVGLFRQNSEFIFPKYAYYWLLSETYQTYLHSKKRGGNQKFVSLGVLRDSPVVLAPLNEQIRIANKLDSILAKVDKAQARLDKIPAILKRFRQSVLAAATSGELTKEWRDDNNVSAQWERVKVASVVSTIEAGKNIKCDERPPNDDEYGIIKISAVTWGSYDEEQSKTLKDNSLFIEDRRVEVGDFLISRANTLELLGMPVIVEQVTKNLMLSDKVLRLVLDDSEKKWLDIFLRSPIGRTEIESRSTGNQQSMRNIGQKALLDIDLLLPSQNEKQLIISTVEQLLIKANKVEKQYLNAKARLDRLTQSILAKAFQGELVPQDPNDEPAEQLLERILKEREQAKPKKTTRKRTTKAKTVEKG